MNGSQFTPDEHFFFNIYRFYIKQDYTDKHNITDNIILLTPNLSTGSCLGFLVAYPLQHRVRDLAIIKEPISNIVKSGRSGA